MATVKSPRNRLVNFRVSEDEFQELRGQCESKNSRSISDFARNQVLGNKQTNSVTISNRLDRIENVMVGMSLTLNELLGKSKVQEKKKEHGSEVVTNSLSN